MNRDDLTEKAFIPDFLDLPNNPSQRIYRTGDLGRITDDGEIEYHLEPQYHGNPVDPKGSLVTMDWGFDIAVFIQETSKMSTLIVQKDNIDLGIRAEFIEVVVSIKSPSKFVI